MAHMEYIKYLPNSLEETLKDLNKERTTYCVITGQIIDQSSELALNLAN